MPWTNQGGGGGGGPWGSGGKGPWGSGPQPTGPKPPDLEEMLRRGQDRLRRFLPGGNLGGRGFALLGVAVIALWGFSGFFRVEPDELGVVVKRLVMIEVPLWLVHLSHEIVPLPEKPLQLEPQLPPPQTPAVQTSLQVLASLSLQVVPFVTAGCVQTPLLHTSLVQALLSVAQLAVLFVYEQTPALQASVVHTLLSLQSAAVTHWTH